MSEIREVRKDASNPRATRRLGGRRPAGNSDPKDKICVSSSTAGLHTDMRGGPDSLISGWE